MELIKAMLRVPNLNSDAVLNHAIERLTDAECEELKNKIDAMYGSRKSEKERETMDTCIHLTI